MDLPRVGDMIAIPFFLWLVLYFLRKPTRTTEEWILLLFVAGGFVADLYFVFGYPTAIQPKGGFPY